MTEVQSLRGYMADRGLSAFIFPSTDPHCGEYIPEHWAARRWISGFDGSAGTAVVTLDDAALWTDSRYFLAAERMLEGTPFRLMKEGVPGTPDIAGWLCARLPEGSKVGMDGWVNTVNDVRGIAETLRSAGLELVLEHDPAAELWSGRPDIPRNAVEIQPLEFCGEEAGHKLRRLRDAMKAIGASATIVSQLDEVAWLTNLRGTDVRCNPVFVSYLFVTGCDAVLFVDPGKVPAPVAAYLQEQGISVRPYDKVREALGAYEGATITFDPSATNWNIASSLPEGCRVIEHASLTAPMKAVKNEAEMRGFRNAMRRDGAAMVRFLRWLGPAVERGGQTEMSIDRKLTSLRAGQPLYRDISFDTIAGYAAHGAIVHYEATKETDAVLEPRGFLLLDSGAQYQDGTTDITRTIALGPLTREERLDYTLVLKGHLRLAMAKFPSGACGTQLDALARYAMWQHAVNFLHGTGHGVGSYLNVHEGPHQIRMNYKPAPLLAGMTVTDEPGIYRAGRHGVRIENTLAVTEYRTTEFGRFLQFEALTLCPIDTAPIITDMMEPDELDYLNAYHKRVCDELLSLLGQEDREWLREACRPITLRTKE